MYCEFCGDEHGDEIEECPRVIGCMLDGDNRGIYTAKGLTERFDLTDFEPGQIDKETWQILHLGPHYINLIPKLYPLMSEISPAFYEKGDLIPTGPGPTHDELFAPINWLVMPAGLLARYNFLTKDRKGKTWGARRSPNERKLWAWAVAWGACTRQPKLRDLYDEIDITNDDYFEAADDLPDPLYFADSNRALGVVNGVLRAYLTWVDGSVFAMWEEGEA
jgi:hypothetical protein